MSWTQPICVTCWNIHNPNRLAHTMAEVCETETCCYCGKPTTSGIYVREDPKAVPYPS